MRLFVGPATHKGDLAKLAARFDLVEIRAEGAVPRAATLRSWRRSVGPGFVFSVVLPRIVGELARGAEAEEALGRALEVARLLEARSILLQTAPSVRPTTANRDRITALVEKLPKLGSIVAWEPSGLWEPEEIRATARQAQVLPVVDAAQQEVFAGGVVYTRVRALGAARLSDKALDHLARQVRGRREVFVAVENPADATRVKASLQRAITATGGGGGGVVVRPVPGRLRAEDEEQ